jgi:hypothetical protein
MCSMARLFRPKGFSGEDYGRQRLFSGESWCFWKTSSALAKPGGRTPGSSRRFRMTADIAARGPSTCPSLIYISLKHTGLTVLWLRIMSFILNSSTQRPKRGCRFAGNSRCPHPLFTAFLVFSMATDRSTGWKGPTELDCVGGMWANENRLYCYPMPSAIITS